jgi:NADPH:quinone reductase-like Zn-dependent oxidoreductase
MVTTSAVPIGTLPEVGDVPARMIALVMRQDRLGEPDQAFKIEEVDTPQPKADKARARSELPDSGPIDPVLSRVLPFEEIPRADQDMLKSEHAFGNTAILVGAAEPGLGKCE